MTKKKTRPDSDQDKTIGQLVEEVNKLQEIQKQLEEEEDY